MDQLDAKAGGDVTDARGLTGVFQGPARVVTESEFESDNYKMDHGHRGVALIINNTEFHQSTGMGDRTGSDVDASQMYDILSIMKFKILIQRNITAQEMRSCLRKAGKDDHADRDCFLCVILTHGEEGYVWGTDNKIPIDDLVAPLKGDKCLTLAGKPKIFFIQACRGTKLDAGVTESDAVGDMEESDHVEQRRIPTEADFLLAYSVVPGFFSWRNSKNGSWFIQAIVKVFQNSWKELDLLTMMTRACRKVAYDFESNASRDYMNRKKQIPCITSMLTRDVYFN